MIELSSLVAALTLDNEQYMKSLGQSMDEGQSVVDQLGNLGGGIVTGIGVGAAAAAAGGVLLLEKAAEEAMAAEEVTAKLNATLANTGDVTGVTADMVDQLANHWQGLTRFEDDNIKAGGEVLARFDEINKDAFPDALKLSLDLAQRLGMDVPSAAMLMGKALADPGVGLMKLKQAGVVFNDEQEKMIDTMLKSGDQAGAIALIMDSVNESVGGAAEAAGATAGGMWERLKNQWGNILELAGTGLLPLIMMLGQYLMDYLNRPEVTAFIQTLADNIATFAQQVITWIPQVVMWFQNAFGWLEQNQGVIVAALAVIGVAIAAWVYTTVIPAAIAAVTAMAPILLVMAVIGIAAYLLYEAWTNNWGGIQEKLAAVWAVVQPVLQMLWNWLQTNIPLALQALSAFWTGTLLPAIQAVWGWIQTNLMPLFTALGELIGVALTKNSETWGALWTNTLLPALQALGGWVDENLMPILEWLGELIGERLTVSFGRLTEFIHNVTGAIQDLAGWLSNINLPDWMTPGSPTPWEIGLLGVQDALQVLARSGLPGFEAAVALSPLAPAASGIDLQPRTAGVATETGPGNSGAVSVEALLQEFRLMIADLPNTMARANQSAFEKIAVSRTQ